MHRTQNNITMEVIAKINVDTAKGRKIVRELEKSPKVVKVEHPLPDYLKNQKLYTVEEFFDKLDRMLGDFYGEEYFKGLKK